MKDYLHQIRIDYDNAIKFDGNCIEYVETYGCNVYRICNDIHAYSTNVININSDYIVKTGGVETDYTLTTGSNGYVMEYNKDTNIPIFLYSFVCSIEKNKEPLSCP